MSQCEKFRNSDTTCVFQATICAKVALLMSLRDHDMGIGSMIAYSVFSDFETNESKSQNKDDNLLEQKTFNIVIDLFN